MNLSPALNVAVRAARRAGSRAVQMFDRPDRLRIHDKGGGDLVTSADTEVESMLLYDLNGAYPDYGILAEESGHAGEGDDEKTKRFWIVDPIDGTANFARNIPHFALSIALMEKNAVIGGLVYNPVLDELFVAERGRGAFLNDRRIRVSNTRRLEDSLLATGFPHRKKSLLEPYLKSFQLQFEKARGVRRAGSAALDLAYVAAGRYDGFWEARLSPWDIAAGALLVKEAGGFITDFQEKSDFLTSGNVIAAAPALHGAMLEQIKVSGLADA